ncbi:MAG: Fis family transcriptional regulator [Myxococcales bacterium]|nr:Fis family transcriptional regulator [Myxococcales bacterium]
MAILTVQKEAASGELLRRAVFKRVTTIGAASDCDVVLEGADIGDLHAMIILEGTGFDIVRGPDTNSLLVNGQKKKKATLEHGTSVSIGGYEIRFDLFDDRDPSPPARSDALLDAYRRLHQFSLRLSATEKVEQLLERLLDDVLELANAEKGFIFLINEDEPQQLIARNIRSPDKSELEQEAWSDTIVQEVIETRKPVIVSDAMNDDVFKNSLSVVNMRLTSVLCVPLLHQETLLGVLYLGNNNIVSLFTPETLSIITVFSGQAALLIQSALHMQELRSDRDRLKGEIEQRKYGNIVGSSEKMRSVFQTIERVSATDLPVLIEGETGTGKELVAAELHRRSTRSEQAFVALNCGAIPENLLESELFGHVRGAFSGAVTNHRGFFERADGSTLFLDEIGELPVKLQVKLLRVLEEKIVRPVGAEKGKSIDVRIVAATNRNVEELVKEGLFREDLFYRLNGIRLALPPLRDRDEDVVLIARALLSMYAKDMNSNVKGFHTSGIAALLAFDWPGNVRQLENRIRKALILADGSLITDKDLGLENTEIVAVTSLSEAKEQFARDYVLRILNLNNGNRAKTAKELGVDPRTIYRYLNKDTQPPDPS